MSHVSGTKIDLQQLFLSSYHRRHIGSIFVTHAVEMQFARDSYYVVIYGAAKIDLQGDICFCFVSMSSCEICSHLFIYFIFCQTVDLNI